MTHEYTLLGAPITKKNSMQILRAANGRAFIAPSKQYKAYEKDCIRQLADRRKPRIATPVNVRCVYYMPTRRKVDLCNLLGATCDILIAAGVLEDDNSTIVVSHDGCCVRYDKTNPRVEVFVEDVVCEAK